MKLTKCRPISTLIITLFSLNFFFSNYSLSKNNELPVSNFNPVTAKCHCLARSHRDTNANSSSTTDALTAECKKICSVVKENSNSKTNSKQLKAKKVKEKEGAEGQQCPPFCD